MTYNGWTNKETWLVNVWFNPEHVADVNHIESMLDDMIEDATDGAGIIGDFLRMCEAEVNWYELRKHMHDFEDEEE